MAAIRELALNLLLQKESTVPFPVLLEQAYTKIPDSAHSTQEKAFLMALCYGVLRYAGLLKQMTLPYCRKKPRQSMELCLCLALYELFFLGKSPYAIVNEYVEILKKQEGQAARALNAILHSILNNKERVQKEIAVCQELIQTPIPSNQIPGKKALHKLHQLADLPELFTENLHRKFYQLLVEESFSAPVPGFRTNLLKEMNLPQGLEQVSPSIVFLPAQNTVSEQAEQIERTKTATELKALLPLRFLRRKSLTLFMNKDLPLPRFGICAADAAEKALGFWKRILMFS